MCRFQKHTFVARVCLGRCLSLPGRCPIRQSCRWQYFFLEPVAHTLLYGIVKMFWGTALRDEVEPFGEDLWISRTVRAEMRRRFNGMRLHGSLMANFIDVACALALQTRHMLQYACWPSFQNASSPVIWPELSCLLCAQPET